MSQTNPPKGDLDQAERYINQLVDLLNQHKIDVVKTDLTKFDPTALKDHYSIALKEYQIEISRSEHQESGKNSYVMIFNNLQYLAEGNGEKVILAYIYLDDTQFSKFKESADVYIKEKERIMEEKQFAQALEPIDELLKKASNDETTHYLGSDENTDSLNKDPDRQIHQI